MTNAVCQLARRLSVAALLVFALRAAPAESIPARHTVGTVHGFLTLSAEDGKVVASGDTVQVAHGGQVTLHTLFTFQDGSVDDETTVFSARQVFRLVTDHHVQKGPAFPHPMDMSIDCRSGQVSVHTTGKDGKAEVYNQHMDLPADLANGLVPLAIENLRPGASEATVSMVVATPKPRIVKLVISPLGQQEFSIAGAARKAEHFQIKIQIGGLAGVVAPLVGKAPPNIDVWLVGGAAPTFLREQGPTYEDGPSMTIELASPVWPNSLEGGA